MPLSLTVTSTRLADLNKGNAAVSPSRQSGVVCPRGERLLRQVNPLWSAIRVSDGTAEPILTSTAAHLEVIKVFKEILHNPLLWLLAFVPVVLAGEKLKPEAHTLLFLLSILALVPLAALLSHATESVAAKTGDAVGGLLNATLGNLTEMVIALAALRAGQYVLVKASIAGAIVTNSLFVLGASFLLGGLKHHLQEFNRISARLQASLLFLATIALLVPSVLVKTDSTLQAAFTGKLSFGLAVLLLLSYGLGMVFSLKTHREMFESADHAEKAEAPWPIGLALATLAVVTVLVALAASE